MLVHTVEHYYHAVVEGKEPKTDGERVRMVINAIRRAQKKIEGSFAACVAFPDLPGIFAMKSGSSLYAGKGSDAAGDFIVVSSDLTSVLSKTRFLIPLAEGEVIYFTEQDYLVFSLHDDTEHRPGLSTTSWKSTRKSYSRSSRGTGPSARRSSSTCSSCTRSSICKSWMQP
jgi:glucosamine 6-phosphate synthetase-like amidotransferase/phosphosugar isomerase protein